MNPFDLEQNPRPWSADYDPDSGCWYIMDHNGNDFLYGLDGNMNKETINFIVKTINATSI